MFTVLWQLRETLRLLSCLAVNLMRQLELSRRSRKQESFWENILPNWLY